jgi:hypothetical protein
LAVGERGAYKQAVGLRFGGYGGQFATKDFWSYGYRHIFTLS